MRAFFLLSVLLVGCESDPADPPARGSGSLEIQAPAPEFCGDHAVLRVAADRDITVDTSRLPPVDVAMDICFFDLFEFRVPIDDVFARCEAGMGFADVVYGTARIVADADRTAVIPATALAGKEGVFLTGSDLCVGSAILLPGASGSTTAMWEVDEVD